MTKLLKNIGDASIEIFPPLLVDIIHSQEVSEYYEIQEKLGEGSFCKVYRALYIPTSEVIAVKVKIEE
jgi:serine/threonine protein kinase